MTEVLGKASRVVAMTQRSSVRATAHIKIRRFGRAQMRHCTRVRESCGRGHSARLAGAPDHQSHGVAASSVSTTAKHRPHSMTRACRVPSIPHGRLGCTAGKEMIRRNRPTCLSTFGVPSIARQIRPFFSKSYFQRVVRERGGKHIPHTTCQTRATLVHLCVCKEPTQSDL